MRTIILGLAVALTLALAPAADAGASGVVPNLGVQLTGTVLDWIVEAVTGETPEPVPAPEAVEDPPPEDEPAPAMGPGLEPGG